MSLRNKFIILIGTVVVLSYGVTFYRASSFQEDLVIALAGRQARMLHKQILLTRKWIADHNGLFFLKQPGVEPNPFLKDPEIFDAEGRAYVKRNPAMVTRELSEYAGRAGLFQYRVTTLRPINPANAPDDFERQSLESFEKGVPEVISIEGKDAGKYLRYMAPLLVEEPCLECHAEQGYAVGDIRGGLSVTIPMDWAFQIIEKNNAKLITIGVITILLVALVIFLVIDFLVVRRLGKMAQVVDSYPEQSHIPADLPGGNDEIGRLSKNFSDLFQRLSKSQQDLDKAREQVFHNEKLAALGRLTAGIAHEINNPLGGMKNCVKSMRAAPDNMELQVRYLGLLEKGLDRIGATVRQLLNFGRREPLYSVRVKVDTVIRECCSLLEYSLKDIDLTLDLQISGSYLVDVEALKQVLVNIGINSIQAMEGHGSLEVKSRRENEWLKISIRDSGPGIDPEIVEKIFDPFFTTKGVGEGTGLGLSVCHTLVGRMGGRIEVDSVVGAGSLFTVVLPANQSNEQAENI
jgi:signal transduction histidine kinase